jgi:hypothetical protein
MSPEKCGHRTRDGAPCQAWAVRGSSPPRCAAHRGRPTPAPPAGAEGGCAEADIIAGVIADLAAKQQRLSAYIDDLLCTAADRPPVVSPEPRRQSRVLECGRFRDKIERRQAEQGSSEEHVVSPDRREGEARDPSSVPTAGREGVPLRELAHLLALHSQNAARLGRLLRDQRALSGEAADGLSNAITQALDELATEWGIDL